MPAKRKATVGAASVGRPSKRSASAMGTPQSKADSDYVSSSGESESDNVEEDSTSRAVKAFTEKLHKQPAKKAIKGQQEVDSDSDNETDALPLKPDHQSRPLWIDAKGKIILEAFHPLAKYAQEFLTSIAEPLSRPSHVHEYNLTIHSLYTAMSVGLSVNDIINTLSKFLKTPLPKSIVDFIRESTQAYGRVKLVLKNNNYYLETPDAGILQRLMKDEEISKLGLQSSVVEAAPTERGVIIPGTRDAAGMRESTNAETAKQQDPDDLETDELLEALRADDDDDDEEYQQQTIHSVLVPKENVEFVTKRCLALQLPLLEEYDFNNDEVNPKLEIDLKPGTKIRDYQEKSLGKMFGNSRARSGIIVLPCGAGKTLVGVTAACTVRRSVIVLCTSEMSVVQWRNEFLKWSNISPDDITVFTANHRQKFSKKAGIIVCTYAMLAHQGRRAHEAKKMMEFIHGQEWGLLLLDEVHVVPAKIFRRVASMISSHCKLGLTATLLREDDSITDLNFLVGPKLYEANWMELSNQGHIARVQCAEVWCPMTAEFYQEYLNTKSKKRQLLCGMNPRKIQACQFLIDYHEKRGDKVIVFSDNVYCLQQYAQKLHKAYIFGETSQNERMKILENFQHNDQINTIFLSKIGDTSLDLPEATCLIQVTSHFGSRRQEAQRLGRILRAKRRNDEGFNAFFYTLVSKDTSEMVYASKRQRFLVDQGYAFKVITHLQGIDKLPDLAYSTPREQRELLQEVLLASETAADTEVIEDDFFGSAGTKKRGMKKAGVRRQAGTLSDLSGGQDMAYIEFNRSRNKELGKAPRGKSVAERLMAQQKREEKRRKDMMAK